ncbi:MAG: phage integrase SAM-like domain-containing protein [Bacteroidales bacterium]|nr:phage integrase SAM-like domain-containing protein [Bacteroidales bacterium]
MKTQKATASFILLKQVTNTEGKFAIRLIIYSNGKKKRYTTSYFISEEDWEKLFKKNLKDRHLKELRTALEAIRARAESIFDKMEVFSFTAFAKEFFAQPDQDQQNQRNPTIKLLFDQYITRLKNNGQAGTAISYQTTINSLEKFRADALLHDVTSDFLQSYENHLSAAGKSNTTIGIYMRQLRAVINQAIKNKQLSPDNYPFASYSIPSGRNIKKALSDDDLSKLLNHNPTNLAHQKALDFWIFSYLCGGMNFADIAHLKPENIDDDYLVFTRQKTIRTKKKNQSAIRVGLPQKAKEIIEKYKNNDEDNPFLFSILLPNLSPLQEKYRIQKFIKWVNKQMEAVRQELDIKINLATYSARHTFSTRLMRKGVPTSFIKEALGHSSVATTEAYLGSFSDDTKMDYAKLLMEDTETENH